MRQLKQLGGGLLVLLAFSAFLASAAWATSPPVNTSPPRIYGKGKKTPEPPEQSETVNSTVGTWSNEPTTYAYQWLRCNAAGAECSKIAGATVSTYTVAAADVGHALVLDVTAKNSAGEATAASAVTQVVPPINQPQLSPAPTETKTLAFSGTSGGVDLYDNADRWDCTSASISGTFFSATEAKKVKVTLNGCSEGLGSRTSEYLRATLGYVSEANHTAALNLTPEAATSWLQPWWFGLPIEGSVIGGLGPVNTKTTGLNLLYERSHEVQEIQRFEKPLVQPNQHLFWNKGEMVIQTEFRLSFGGSTVTLQA
jgi:hypothetical protein